MTDNLQISLTHNPRTEDYPVMPCDTMTVSLKPSGFFGANPALDVPQSTAGVNGSRLVDEALVDAVGEELEAKAKSKL